MATGIRTRVRRDPDISYSRPDPEDGFGDADPQRPRAWPLQRWPLRTDDPLRAWDTADEYLLDHLEEAPPADDGELRGVGNRHLGYHVKLKRVFGNAEVVGSDRRFVVINCIKK